MAINPATGLEDPNYDPNATTALEGTETSPIDQVGDLNLTDPTNVMEDTRTGLKGIGEEAQTQMGDVTRGDVNYESPDTTKLFQDSGIKKGTDYMTPESTVENQLTRLLDTDSKYMETARRRAQEDAASRGLLGSSMAIGATHRAAIESGLPIAQQDAKTYAEFQLGEQKAMNEMSRMKMESDLSAAAREHMYDIDSEKLQFSKQMDLIAQQAAQLSQAETQLGVNRMTAQWDAETREHLAKLEVASAEQLAKIDQETKREMARIDAETKELIANIEADLQMKVSAQEISSAEREYASKTSSQIMAAAYGTINDLMGNADFMAGYADNPEGLTSVFNNFINLAKDQVRFIGASAGLTQEYNDPNSGYLEFIGDWSTVDAPTYEEPATEEPAA